MKKTFVVCFCIVTLLLSIGLSSVAAFWAASRYFSEQAPLYREVLAETVPQQTQLLQTQPEKQREYSVVDIAQMCTKSVVNITIKEVTKGYTGGSAYSEKVISHGTGVIVREDGYIVTCHHVIDGADTIEVTLDDKTVYPAELIGFDERFDLAVIRVDGSDMPAAQFGDSDAVCAGEGVVIIGNPLGEFGSSVSSGVLSAPTRELTISGTPLRLMQTDAAVNPGKRRSTMLIRQPPTMWKSRRSGWICAPCLPFRGKEKTVWEQGRMASSHSRCSLPRPMAQQSRPRRPERVGKGRVSRRP